MLGIKPILIKFKFQSRMTIYLTLLVTIFMLSQSFNLIHSQKVRTYKDFTYTEKDVRTKIYSDYKTPENFYQDRLEKGDKMHDSIYYHGQPHSETSYFYSTDEYDKARTRVENDMMNSNVANKEISEEYENEKYFEFKTEETKTNGHTYILRHRIHKTSYISLRESSIARIWPQTNESIPIEIGILNQKPVHKSNSKELIEYLWFISNYNYFGAIILDKKITEIDGNIYYAFLETAFVGGDWGMNDVIYLTYSNYSINKTSGEIILIQEVFREIEGKYHSNVFFTPIELLVLPLAPLFIAVIWFLWRRQRKTGGRKDDSQIHINQTREHLPMDSQGKNKKGLN
jgi:hypothetical protein